MKRDTGVEQTVKYLLDAEKEASFLADQASAEAGKLRAAAEDDAKRLLDESEAAANSDAGQLIAGARAQAEEERRRLLSEAEEQATGLERDATPRFEIAVREIVQAILGLEGEPQG